MGKIIVEGMEFEIMDLLDLRFGSAQLLGMDKEANTETLIDHIRKLNRQ